MRQLSEPTLASVGINRPMLGNTTERFTFPYGRDDHAPVYDVGVPPKEHDTLINTVALAVYRSGLRPTADYQAVASGLSAIVDSTLRSRGGGSKSPVLRQWLLAEAVGAFCVSRIDYATEQAQSGFDARRRSSLNEPESYLANPKPRAVCSGFTRYAARLSRVLKLTCYHIDGFTRNRNISDWAKPTHGWLLYDFGSGIRVPSDMTSRIHEFSSGRTVSNTDFARLPHKYNWRILPRSVRDWELFTWMYFQYRLVPGEKMPENLSMTTITFDSWRDLTYNDAVDQLYIPLLRWYQKADTSLINDVAY